jgi:hypothetical protein
VWQKAVAAGSSSAAAAGSSAGGGQPHIAQPRLRPSALVIQVLQLKGNICRDSLRMSKTEIT